MFQKLVNLVLHPEGRLKPNFPWGWMEAGTRYFVASFWFALGTLAPVAAFSAFIALMIFYPTVLLNINDPAFFRGFVGWTGVFGALLGFGVYVLRSRRRETSDSTTAFVVLSSLYAFAGAVFTIFVTLFGVHWLAPRYEPMMRAVLNFMADANGQPTHHFLMTMSAASFVAGFGLEINYIRKALARQGHSLSNVMGLSLSSLRGGSWWVTAWRLVWPVAATYGIWVGLEQVIGGFLGHPEQPTVDLARAISGGNFLLFALMAAVGAPIFEEIVFRGFLFQVLRSSLRREPERPVFALPESGRLLAIRRLLYRVRYGVASFSFRVMKVVYRLSVGKVDFVAVIVSSAMFSLSHMQFHPVTMLSLFLLGALHAELYRRTGSLYSSMLLHMVNNGLAVLLIALS